LTSNPGSIEFGSAIPYYVQLIELLKEQIIMHSWKPGDQIPGEFELCMTYGISRTVVRQALQELELNGWIVRRKGKGTFIAESKINESLAQKLTGFYQDMKERGLDQITRVLHQQVIPASEKVAQYLEIPLDTTVIDIKRLRFINNEPIILVTTYIPANLCPQLAKTDLTNRSLYECLEQEFGLSIARGRRFIEAVAANEEEAKLLQVERGAPLILLDSISYLENGTPLEYFHALHRGDRSRFEIELIRTRVGIPRESAINSINNLSDSNDGLTFWQ